jgi:hypothetical protein
MGRLDRCVRSFISLSEIALAFFLGGAGVGHSQNISSYPAVQSRPEAGYLDQGWGHDTAEWWYYVSQGTVFMPYQWFIALEQASGDELFAATDHLERLGFLADLPSAANPRGLPVGFPSASSIGRQSSTGRASGSASLALLAIPDRCATTVSSSVSKAVRRTSTSRPLATSSVRPW